MQMQQVGKIHNADNYVAPPPLQICAKNKKQPKGDLQSLSQRKISV